MNLYNYRQLVVILTIIPALFLFFLLRTASKRAGEGPAISDAPNFVYELRGNINKEGFYCFNKEQTLPELIRACEGFRDEGQLTGNTQEEKVKSGSRVTFMDDVQVEKMDARARMNFFLPLPVNSSSEEDLTLIPGIGIKTAKAIVDYRKTGNGIRDLQELTDIKGLGRKKMQLLSPYLSLEQ